MKRISCIPLGCAALLAFPLSSPAQETGLSWNLSAVSEYLYRSVSQSDENPTLQGEINWTSPIGIYAGSWASGVDFGPGDPNVEVDYYLGYATPLTHSLGLDVRLARYTNPGAGELDWNELTTTVTVNDSWAAALHYSNDVFATGSSGWYLGVDLDINLSAHAGRSLFRNNAIVGRDYTDWNIGLSRTFGPANVTLGWYGTDGNGRRNYGKLADNRLFVSISIGE